MAIDIFPTILAGAAASIAWFIIGGALYTNPFVAKIYKNAEKSPGLKKWASTLKYIGLQYVGILAQCLLWAFVFALVKAALPESAFSKGIVFGFILIVVKIFPRFFDMWIQSTYPNQLLAVEFINGAIGSFVIGVVLAYVIV
jgi:predicted membrane-bound spermidine synthase